MSKVAAHFEKKYFAKSKKKICWQIWHRSEKKQETGQFSGLYISMQMTEEQQRKQMHWSGKDKEAFLNLVKESGRSSWELLQNITPAAAITHQDMAVALAVAEKALNGKGACRVHGGGFAGTIQAFVPVEDVCEFKKTMETMLSEGCCHVLSIRPAGGLIL